MQDWVQIILTLVAALIGSYFGAFAKELFSDHFLKRRRRRETRTAITEKVVLIFRLMQRHIQLRQFSEIHKHRLELLKRAKQKLIANGEEKNKEEISKITSDLDGIFVYTQKFIDDDSKVVVKIAELESQIISNAYESIYYFERHQSIQLKRNVKEMIEWFESTELNTQTYSAITDYTEFIVYQDQVFSVKLGIAVRKLRSKQEYYVDIFNEILSE